jgi:hypothetical protein
MNVPSIEFVAVELEKRRRSEAARSHEIGRQESERWSSEMGVGVYGSISVRTPHNTYGFGYRSATAPTM